MDYKWQGKKQFLLQEILLLFPIQFNLFLNLVQMTGPNSIKNALKGIKEPKNEQDNQFLLMKPYNSESTLGKVEFLPTSGYDNLFQSFDVFDISKL
jgi:hypothetical protein